jgi:Sel1 repeat
MKCIFCKICEANQAIFDKITVAWLEAQTNSVAIMEREADPTRIYQAHDLLETDPAESFRQYLALAESGSVWSMAVVGHRFENGTGTARDLAQAEMWYLRAYRAGSDHGLLWLGDLYQESKQHQKAQDVFRTGVERGLMPAMVRLASSYWNSADRPQRRDEALALLERGSAAGDLYARRFLGNLMIRGSFGLRRIPAGIRLMFGVAKEMDNFVENEKATAQSDGKPRPGFFSRLTAQFWLLDATRHPAS